MKQFILGLAIGTILFFTFKFFQSRLTISPDKSVEYNSETVSEFTIDGVQYFNLPGDLTEAMTRAQSGFVLNYKELSRLHGYADNPDIDADVFLALAWLQSKVVDSGVYIDQLQKDVDIGLAFAEEYYDRVQPEDPAKYLKIVDELERLNKKIQWFEETKPR